MPLPDALPEQARAGTKILVDVVTRTCAKRGEAENEDAHAIHRDHCAVAVADGATVGFETKRWAQLLADQFVASPPAAEAASVSMRDWLRAPRSRWQEEVEGEDLPWYAQEGMERGAAATLLGLVWSEDATQWQAWAVGDTCLFSIRSGWMTTSFPIRDADAFNNTPSLLSSGADASPVSTFEVDSGAFESGDVLLLASDALAAWMLHVHAMTYPRLNWAEWTCNVLDDFDSFVERERQRGTLVNDDTTLVVVTRQTKKSLLRS